MGKWNKLREKSLPGESDANLAFDDRCHWLRRLGFAERISGSHHIFSRRGVEEIVNLQPKGGTAKTYRVAQIRGLILKYRLGDALND